MAARRRSWVPFYETLDTRVWLSRSARYVFLQACLRALLNEGEIELSTDGSAAEAFAEVIGGRVSEAVEAFQKLVGSQPDGSRPMLSLRERGGRRWIEIDSWEASRPGDLSTDRTRKFRQKLNEERSGNAEGTFHGTLKERSGNVPGTLGNGSMERSGNAHGNVPGNASSTLISSSLSEISDACARANSAEAEAAAVTTPTPARVGGRPAVTISDPFTEGSDSAAAATAAIMPGDAPLIVAAIAAVRSAAWCYPSASVEAIAKIAATLVRAAESSREVRAAGVDLREIMAAVVAHAIADRGKTPARSDAALVAMFPTFLTWEIKNITSQNRRNVRNNVPLGVPTAANSRKALRADEWEGE